jgi:hypothetical protein
VNGVTQPPQQERLYAGGAASVRGYQQNELGSLLYVFDDTSQSQIQIRHASPDSIYFTFSPIAKQRRVVPVGGNRLFVASVDYRVRSPILPRLLQFTLFTDAGTVWNWDTKLPLGGSALRLTPGIGLRAFTPLGPIQINAGYNPYPPVFGQPLFTPNRDLAQQGFTGVYCVVPEGFPVDSAPKSGVNPANGQFQQNPNAVCKATYQQSPPTRWINRVPFTFSIGPEF